MQAMEARPASDVLQPQIPRHVSMLSSEIVRPVFQRDMARSSAVENTLKRGATRADPPSFAADRIQAERCLGSNYNTNAPAYDDAFAMVAEHESEHLRGYETDQLQLKKKRIRCKTQRRLEQCRASQARYRQKQIDHTKWDLCLQLCRIERSTTDRFVSMDATLNVTVSEARLENVFPLVKDQFLRSKLLGQHLQVPYSVCFEWDPAACRLSRVDTTTNFMTPLMGVLGNLADVASVLEHALITRDGTVGINDIGPK
ncbi:hypothetical protein GQ600_10819 [Phytophthora cactorum]|nr:hypothetical protein GQ600_10819 [Phytophthora cactorum]